MRHAMEVEWALALAAMRTRTLQRRLETNPRRGAFVSQWAAAFGGAAALS